MLKLSENTSDALRNTLTALLPLIVLYSSWPQLALGVAVGALLISLTDLPGNRRAKTLSAVQCICIFFLVTLVFSLSLTDQVWTGITLVCITFVLSMLSALGARSSVSGMMGVGLMVFLLGLRPRDPWAFSAYIMLGGIWFYIVVLVQVYLWPFRSLKQALQEALYVTGEFLEAKAACYDLNTPLDDGYSRTIALHLRVSEKQELVRQILISDRAAMRKANAKVKVLSDKAVLVIGLYEQITAMHYDYAIVRERLGPTGALTLSEKLIRLLAAEAKGDKIDAASYLKLLARLEAMVAVVPKSEAAVIKGLVTNIKAIKDKLDAIYMSTPQQNSPALEDIDAFLPDKGNYLQKLKAQLHFRSPVLRFSLRLALLLAIGYTAACLFADDNYSYWLLLTIVIVARPRLAVTWQRNRERLLGTFAGVVIAGSLIWIVRDVALLLMLAAVALFGFFAWNRPKYGWSVACITICVLLSLSVYKGEPLLLLSARVWYSLLGCGLAIVGIFVFPVWSHSELDDLVTQAVKANRAFLAAVAQGLPLQQVRLARKEAHVRMARLSEGLSHARVEPGKGDLDSLRHIQVLNYRINAVIISLFLAGRVSNSDSLGRSLANLDSFVERSKYDLVDEKKDGLLKGAQLLERLSQQLAGVVQK